MSVLRGTREGTGETVSTKGYRKRTIKPAAVSNAPLSERVKRSWAGICGYDPDDGRPLACSYVANEIAALEDRLRVSEAKRVIEREAADDWQERFEAMGRILARERDVRTTLEGDDDE